MRIMPGGRSPVSFPMMLAGWLFADLLLVLFVVGLASEPTVLEPEPTSVATPTPTPTPSPTPEAPLGLDRTPVTVTLQFDSNRLVNPATRAEVTAELRQPIAEELAQPEVGDASAGMVLIWGYSRDVNEGIRIAEIIGPELAPARPEVFENTTYRAFWRGGPDGRVDLEIYLLSR